MLTQDALLTLLQAKGISYEITHHPAVFNMAEVAQIKLPYPEVNAKNLFVRDHKRRDYYMITVLGHKRVDLKAFRHAHGLRALTFATPEELLEMLGLIPGAVTPFGLLNDQSAKVHLYIDSELVKPNGLIGAHPNDNRATLWLKTDDLQLSFARTATRFQSLTYLKRNGSHTNITRVFVTRKRNQLSVKLKNYSLLST